MHNLKPALLSESNSSLTIDKIGTYRLEEGHFLYLWCDDVGTRQNAALERILHLIEQHKKSITVREVVRNLQLLSEQLAIRTLDLNDLKRRAGETRRSSLLKTIDGIE